MTVRFLEKKNKEIKLVLIRIRMISVFCSKTIKSYLCFVFHTMNIPL